VKLEQQKLSKYYAKVTQTTIMVWILAHIFNPFWKSWLFRKWDKGKNINPEDKTFYTTQYQEVFLKYVTNEYCAKHQLMLVNEHENIESNTLVPYTMASDSAQSFFHPYDLPSDDEE